MRNFIVLLCLVLTSIGLKAQNYLRVGDPKTFYTRAGTIEKASFAVSKKGLFIEHNLYLTFSARGSGYTNNDSLEIVCDFQLPTDAMVTDSWLWVGDKISKGKLLDIWTASNIYENIVKRRQDPSILKKTGQGMYNLRVFPMAGNETRRVKITYLTAGQFNKTKQTVSLPSGLLNASYYKVQQLELLVENNLDVNFFNAEGKTIDFVKHPDSTLANYKQGFYSSNTSSYGSMSFVYNNLINNESGVYFATYPTSSTSGYYELAYLPNNLVNEQINRKSLFIVDFDQVHTDLTKEDFKAQLKFNLKNLLLPTDSFNLVLSNFSSYQYSPVWVSASQENIELALNKIDSELASYSNLAPALATGINFIKNNQDVGDILLLSCSENYKSYESANALLSDIDKLMGAKKIPVHILDFNIKAYSYTYFNGQRYYGNEYFFTNLGKQTKGSSIFQVYLYPRPALTELIDKQINESLGSIQFLDLQVKLESGYSFGNKDFNKSANSYFNSPFLRIGKYNGSQATLQVNGQYKDKFYTKSISLNTSTPLDSTATMAWAGALLTDLEKSERTNSTVNSIVDLSLSSHVLSLYTAFLCLEDSSYYCTSCVDESNQTGIDGLNKRDSLLFASPNPFTEELQISLNIQEGELSTAQLKLIDLQGKVVYTFSMQDFTATGVSYTYSWKPSEAGLDLQSGMYFLSVVSKDTSKVLKVVKQ